MASSSEQIACGSSCSAWLDPGARVTLLASPGKGWKLKGWGGACTGTSQSCTVNGNDAATVGARLVRVKKPVPLCRKHQQSTKQHRCRKRKKSR